MSLGSSLAPFFGAAGGAAGGGGAAADYSLRFNVYDGTYLTRSPSNESNRRTWTWSGWVRRTATLSDNHLMMGSTDTSNWTAVLFDSNRVGVTNSVNGTISYRLTSNNRFRDNHGWYHLVFAVDTTQATDTDRIKIYVNGTLLDSALFSSHNWLPTPSQQLYMNAAGPHRIGSYIPNPSNYGFDGYLADVNFIDGQQLAATDFAELDATTGSWNPLSDLSGLTYGTNGFRLNFNNTASLATLGEDSSGRGNNYTAINFTPLGVTAANTDTISTVALESQAVSTFKNRRGGGSNAGAPNNSWASSINMGDQVINVGSTFNPSDPSVINWNSDAWLYFELDTASAVTIGYPSLISAQDAVLYGSNNGGATWNFIARETNRGRRITSTTAYQYYAYANPGQNVAANDWTILPAKTVLTLASDQDLNKIFENDFVQQDSSETLSTDTISGFTRLDYQNDASFGGNLGSLANAFRPEYNSVPPWQPGQQSVTATFTNLGLYVTSIGVWCTWSNNASGWNVDGSTFTVNGTNVSSTATAVQKPISGWAGSAFLVTHTFSTPTLLTTVTANCASASNYISGYYIDGVKAVKGDTKLTLTGSTNLSNFASGDTIYQDNASAGPTYSSSLTGTVNGSPSTIINPTRLYDGDLGNYATMAGSNSTNIITHNTSISNVQRLEVYLETGNTTSQVYVNGVGPHTNTGAGWNDLGPLIPGNGTVTSIQFSEFYGGSSNFPRVFAIRVNGQILLDNDQIPNGTVLSSAPSANQLLLSGTGGSWNSSSTQTAQVTKAAGTGYVFDVDSGANTIKLVNVANTWVGGGSKYVIGPNTYVSNQNTDTLTEHPKLSASGSDTGVGGQVNGTFCTWNDLAIAADSTLTNGALDVSYGSNARNAQQATFGMSSGQWYWEITITAGSVAQATFIGIADSPDPVVVGTYTGSTPNGWGYYGGTGQVYNGGAASSYGDTWGLNDVIGVAFDATNGTLSFYKNGVVQNGGTPAYTGLAAATYFPSIGDGSFAGTFSATANFGQRPYAYQDPGVNRPSADFKALCSANLTDPTILDPSTLMDVALYTGNNTSQTVTLPGAGFEPGLVWYKFRTGVAGGSNLWFDQIRTAGQALISNSTNQETTIANALTAFTSSGFTVGNHSASNYLNDLYVAWCWNGGPTTVTNNAGDMQSQVRANTSAGFSIQTMTTPSSNGDYSVGHGLGVKPAFVIWKSRTSNGNYWFCQHEALGNMVDYYIRLDSPNPAANSVGRWVQEPTDQLLYTNVGNTWVTNDDLVCYAFAPVAGFSAFGSYLGNGSTNGTYVHTGFKVKWLLFKASDDTTDWILVDAARNPYNWVDDYLSPNQGTGENVFTFVDFLADGFKMRNSAQSGNFQGTTYIYAAFAELPYKNSRAR